MIGTTLKKLLDEREIKVNEFARQIHVPAQTLYSIIRRDNMKIDFELLLRICDALHVPLETFCGTGSTDQPTPEEWETLWKLRRLDAQGRLVTLQLLDAECARMQASEQQPEQQKIIPLYMTPAAAGYASPAFGDDYEDYAVAADSEADFAVRITGDSMEPTLSAGDDLIVDTAVKRIRAEALYVLILDGEVVVKRAQRRINGSILITSDNERYPPEEVTPDEADKLHVAGRVVWFGRSI